MILLLRNSTTCFRSMKGLKRNLRQQNLLKCFLFYCIASNIQNIFSWLTLKWKEIESWKEGILGDTLRPCRARERERDLCQQTLLYSFKWSEKKWKFLLFIEGNQGKRLTFLFSLQQRAFEFTKIIFWTGFANTLFVARPWLLFLVIPVLELLSHPAWI